MELRLKSVLEDSSLTWEIPFEFNQFELSPFKNFYKTFPEAFIMYVNEEAMVDPLRARNFKKVVETTLARYGIDFMHPGFTLGYVREKLYYYFKNKKKMEVQVNRLKELLGNKSVLNTYLKSRISQMESLLSQNSVDGKFN